MGKQAAVGTKKTKEAISKSASSRSTQSKKKWTKGRQKEKLNNAVFIEQASYDLIATQLPKVGKLVTISVLCEKFKINGSLARKLLLHFTEKGIIEVVGDRHHSGTLYTVSAAALASVKTVVDTKATAGGAKGAKGKK